MVQNEQEALWIAIEMERRAIRVYERALLLTQEEAVRRGIEEILQDERRHYQRFVAMKEALPEAPVRDQLLLQALGADVLMSGGVMELHRAQALTTLPGLCRYAADSEADAVAKYTAFADRCQNEAVREAFLSIAQEEAGHLAELRERESRC